MSEETQYGGYEGEVGRRSSIKAKPQVEARRSSAREGFAGTIFWLVVIAFAMMYVLQSSDMG
jgi:hypothetical protein